MTGMTFDRQWAQAAFAARDRSADGRFVAAVTTTGIYCRPSCPARRPRPEHLRFYPDGAAARSAGYRPCLRCKPDEASRDRQAVSAALTLIEQAEEPIALDALAGAVGYAPHHFQRLFKRDMGLTPAQWQRAARARRLEAALEEKGSVTDAIYDAGYQTASRAYAEAGARLGMTPARWKAGGRGETIHFAIAPTRLGPLLVAATARGLCRIAFDEDADALRERFPNADLMSGDAGFAETVAAVVALVDAPGALSPELPRDTRGTAFQEAVWAALRAIPPGETLSYAKVAARIGKPRAVRAVGTACGDNPLAVLVPCHRVLRGDGALGGYAWGLDRKEALLKAERSGPDGA